MGPSDSAHASESPYPSFTLSAADRHYQTYFVSLFVELGTPELSETPVASRIVELIREVIGVGLGRRQGNNYLVFPQNLGAPLRHSMFGWCCCLLISVFPNDDKSRKKRLPLINVLVTLRVNSIEERGLGTLKCRLGPEPSRSHPKEPSFNPRWVICHPNNLNPESEVQPLLEDRV